MILRDRMIITVILTILCNTSTLTNGFMLAATPPSCASSAFRSEPILSTGSLTLRATGNSDTAEDETLNEKKTDDNATIDISGCTRTLAEWDRLYNADHSVKDKEEHQELRAKLPAAIRHLNEQASMERAVDSTKGRVMLGICAQTSGQGLATIKSWVDGLGLPRGLLHGMDKDGQPLDIDDGVYIKYNTGGSLSFSEMRQSGLGFDALWRPGDALLETYDGNYRGVYFQVELDDDEFRQFLVPLDTFGPIEGV